MSEELTDQQLDEIEQLATSINKGKTYYEGKTPDSWDHIEALIAEIRRLREELESEWSEVYSQLLIKVAELDSAREIIVRVAGLSIDIPERRQAVVWLAEHPKEQEKE